LSTIEIALAKARRSPASRPSTIESTSTCNSTCVYKILILQKNGVVKTELRITIGKISGSVRFLVVLEGCSGVVGGLAEGIFIMVLQNYLIIGKGQMVSKDWRIDSIQNQVLSSYQTTTNISPNILSAQRLRLNPQARLFISILSIV
jgi:hypothetical protein